MATVELYRKVEFPGVVQVDTVKNMIARRRDEEVVRLEEIKQVSKELKLTGQVELCEKKIVDIGPELKAESSLDPSHYYPAFSEKEREVFIKWLPDTRGVERYGKYAHDRLIPEKVLLELAAIQGFGFFESLEVMTHQDMDTFEVLLVGYRGKEAFRVARWGERLRPMKNIFRYVRRVSFFAVIKEWSTGGFSVLCLAILMVSLTFLVVACLIHSATGGDPACKFFFSYCPSIIGVSVIGCLFCSYWSNFSEMKFFASRR